MKKLIALLTAGLLTAGIFLAALLMEELRPRKRFFCARQLRRAGKQWEHRRRHNYDGYGELSGSAKAGRTHSGIL